MSKDLEKTNHEVVLFDKDFAKKIEILKKAWSTVYKDIGAKKTKQKAKRRIIGKDKETGKPLIEDYLEEVDMRSALDDLFPGWSVKLMGTPLVFKGPKAGLILSSIELEIIDIHKFKFLVANGVPPEVASYTRTFPGVGGAVYYFNEAGNVIHASNPAKASISEGLKFAINRLTRYGDDTYKKESTFGLTSQEFRELSKMIHEADLPEEEKEKAFEVLMEINSNQVEAFKEKLKEKPEEISKEDNALMENLTSRYLQLKSLNYFEVLGVAQDTDNNTIKNAYFKLAKEYHPDKYHNTPAMRSIASDIFSIINASYNTLSEEKSRIAYLDSLKTGNKQDVVQEAANIMNAEMQFQKGKMALSKKNYNAAKEAFEWAIKLNPDEGEYKAYLGWSIFNISPKDTAEVEKAKGIIEEAVSSNPNQDRAYYFLGVIYKMEGRIRDAETAFRKAVQKNPNIPEALSELRLIQMRKQKDGKGLFKKKTE